MLYLYVVTFQFFIIDKYVVFYNYKNDIVKKLNLK